MRVFVSVLLLAVVCLSCVAVSRVSAQAEAAQQQPAVVGAIPAGHRKATIVSDVELGQYDPARRFRQRVWQRAGASQTIQQFRTLSEVAELALQAQQQIAAEAARAQAITQQVEAASPAADAAQAIKDLQAEAAARIEGHRAGVSAAIAEESGASVPSSVVSVGSVDAAAAPAAASSDAPSSSTIVGAATPAESAIEYPFDEEAMSEASAMEELFESKVEKAGGNINALIPLTSEYDLPTVGATLTGTPVERFVAALRSKLGSRYVSGGAGPTTFDCSGLVQWAARQAGYPSLLPHSADAQSRIGTAITSVSQRRVGDLIFFGKPGSRVYHVGVWLGGTTMINAPNSRSVVRIENYSYWPDKLTTARRLF